jgi:hypothetical protein
MQAPFAAASRARLQTLEDAPDVTAILRDQDARSRAPPLEIGRDLAPLVARVAPDRPKETQEVTVELVFATGSESRAPVSRDMPARAA